MEDIEYSNTDINSNDRSPYFLRFAWIFLLIFIIFDLLFIAVFVSSRAPSNFPLGEPIVIESGLSASAVADVLKENNVVRSSGILYSTLVIFHDPSSIKAGSYIFTEKESAFEIASIITDTAPLPNLLKLTFPEGLSVKDFAAIAAETLPDFDEQLFIDIASSSEGYLFPDTYYVPPNYTEAQLVVLLKETFRSKITNLDLTTSNLNKEDLIILASIIEREANTRESMGIVAGILLDRLELGMPLQTDASMEYILNKPLSELTAEDLDIESPYNTYLNTGLPPTPIGNPGLTSVEALLNPTKTDYLFYITDSEGEFHYAKTYTEHQENIARYLR